MPTITLLSNDHAKDLQKLRLHSLKTDPKSFLSLYQAEKDLPLEYFARKIAQTTLPPCFGIYGYFESAKLLGSIQLSPDYFPKTRHLANVYELYVYPQSRRQGIGAKLLDHLVEKARSSGQVEQLHLRVNSHNQSALNLYLRHGFTQIALRKNAIKEPSDHYQDELLLSLVL